MASKTPIVCSVSTNYAMILRMKPLSMWLSVQWLHSTHHSAQKAVQWHHPTLSNFWIVAMMLEMLVELAMLVARVVDW
jgi:hypothetical protein